jgi:hypothetical protein
MIRIVTFALGTALIASASAAGAQERVKSGVLECRGVTTSFVVGSVTDLDCIFMPTEGGRGEPYMARMKRAGLDIGINQQISIAWGVFAPTRGFARGGLAGSYVGGAASATVGVGVGANALVGGSNNTIALQPVSLQGQTGFGAAAGIAELEIRPAGR